MMGCNRLPKHRRHPLVMAGGRTKGNSLIELTIASFLGTIILSGVLTLLANTQHTVRQYSESVQMDESARLAMDVLRREIAMAGFSGAGLEADAVDFSVLSDLDMGCPLMQWQGNGISLAGYESSELSSNGCVEQADLSPDSEALAVWRAEATPLVHADLQADRTYLIAGPESGRIALADEDTATAVAWQREVYPYGQVLYFSRPCAMIGAGDSTKCDADDDPTPTLVRKTMHGGGWKTEPLVPLVEALHLQFGVAVVTADGTPEIRYQTVEDTPLWSSVVAVRVALLIRSEAPVFREAREQQYTLGNGRVLVRNDRYAYKVYTYTVARRNMTSVVAL